MGRLYFDTDPGSWTARRAALRNSIRTAEVQDRKRVRKLRAHQELQAKQRENRRLAASAVRFSPKTHQRLQAAILGICCRRRAATPEPWAALDILNCKLDTGETDEVVILPTAVEARALVKVLRAPGVDGFCHGLEILERIAETPEPKERGFRLPTAEFFDVLRLVEKDEAYVPSRLAGHRPRDAKVTDGTIYSILSGVTDPKRFQAANILRAVVIRCGHPQLHLTRDEAILVVDVLRGLNAERRLVSRFTYVAEREPVSAA